MFCLIPKQADAFKQEIISGKIDPNKLAEMTSEERRTFFGEKLGEHNAKDVNALFESKLLLKNKQLGYINWAKQLLGDKNPAARDIISKIERMGEDVLKPETEAKFLSDFIEKKLGTKVTPAEAKNIFDMANKMKEAEKKLTTDTPDGSPDALEYGSYKVALSDYVEELKLSNKVSDSNPISKVEGIFGFAKAAKASLDNSAIFNQGGKIKFTNPEIWATNAFKSFGDIMSSIVDGPESNKVKQGVMADILSRQNARNGNYRRLGIDIGEFEEAYPTSLPEKIPLLGRLFKASEVAYTTFLRRCRADIADKYIKMAEENGVNLKDDYQAKSLGKVINSLTGRGSLGSFEAAGKHINVLFFSPKKLVGDIDVLTAHRIRGIGDGNGISNFAKHQASMNLIKYISGTASIMILAKMLYPNSVEEDPRSSDFGTIKIGSTRFDVSGGSKSIAVLAARIATQKTKSTTDGSVSPLNSGKFGSQTGMEVIGNFIKNKLSPGAQLVNELWINKTDFSGQPVTVGGAMKDAFVPLPITNAQEVIQSKDGAPALLTIIADGLGISTNTYAPVQKKIKSRTGVGGKPEKHTK